MALITFLQEHQQGIIAIGVILGAFALYGLLTRKSHETESLEKEYQDIVNVGKRQARPSLSVKTDE